MDLRQLTTFRMVAQTLSFSRTAIALNYVQSSVTAQIQALEDDLGVQLFDRLGKRVALTEAGKRLLVYTEKILDLVNEARCAVQEEEQQTGTVTISAPESICTYRLMPVMREFQARYPHARLVFRPTADERRSVHEGTTDIGFSIDDPIRSASLEVEILVREQLVMIAAPDHPLAHLTKIRNQDIQGAHFLLTEKGCTYRNVFEGALHQAGVDAVTDLEFTSVEAIKQCTMMGMGIAFLPEMVVKQEIEQGKLVSLQWEAHCFEVVTQMFWHREKWLSPAIMAFIKVARELLTKDKLEETFEQVS